MTLEKVPYKLEKRTPHIASVGLTAAPAATGDLAMTRLATNLVTLATALAIVAGSCRDVYAQTPNLPVSPTPLPPTRAVNHNWPSTWESSHTGEIYLYTVAKPTKRRHCQNPGFTPEAISCERGSGKPMVYPMETVQTLTVPGVHSHWWLYFAGFVGAGAGTITSAVFLASVTIIGAIPIAAIGAILLLGSPLTAMMAEEDSPEMPIYLKPGKDLVIRLH